MALDDGDQGAFSEGILDDALTMANTDGTPMDPTSFSEIYPHANTDSGDSSGQDQDANASNAADNDYESATDDDS